MMKAWFKSIGLLYCCSFYTFAEVTKVEAYQPVSQPYHQQLSLTGTIEAVQNAELTPLQAGVVENLFVDFGAQVNKGDRLLQLDATLAELQLQVLEAALVAAQVQLQETQRLYDEVIALSKKQFVAKTLIGERHANLANARAMLSEKQASVSLQQELVNRHTLMAPFAGVIASRNADLGEWVSSQSLVFNLVSNQNLRLKVAIPQEYFSQLQGKQLEVNVIPDHSKQLAFAADLTRLVTVSDPRTRTIIGLIDIPERQGLIAGMSAQAKITIISGDGEQIWLPKTAVKQHPDGGTSVFAVVNNQAKRVLVKVTGQNGDLLALTGASAEHVYIVKGVELLKDGIEVKVTKTTGGAL